ncbi:hypothetical protein VUR80DRAFT_2920 [Thermomyces stellatus]
MIQRAAQSENEATWRPRHRVVSHIYDTWRLSRAQSEKSRTVQASAQSLSTSSDITSLGPSRSAGILFLHTGINGIDKVGTASPGLVPDKAKRGLLPATAKFPSKRGTRLGEACGCKMVGHGSCGLGRSFPLACDSAKSMDRRGRRQPEPGNDTRFTYRERERE